MRLFINLIIFLVTLNVCAQVTFSKIPLDRQLVPRDLITNQGEVVITGEVDNTSTPYTSIEIDILRNDVFQQNLVENLVYTSGIAPFNFSHNIVAELANYTFNVYGVIGTNRTLISEVQNIVAGDVFIIQGQSNAVASAKDGTTSSVDESNFIRTYANPTDNVPALLNDDSWYIAKGDGNIYSNGHIGQWGIKLGKLIVDNENIPVAIFNGGRNAKFISYFQAPANYQTDLNSNYARLYYRLTKNGLKDHVRGIFWSQGESDGFSTRSDLTEYYKNSLATLKASWQFDYINIEGLYIFQTRNGCLSNEVNLMKVKEAQRQFAFENNDVQIMPTANLDFSSDNCHFMYNGGYDKFGERLFNLIERDMYGGAPTSEVDAPMITAAYLTNPTTLVVETDANGLVLNGVGEDFILEDTGNATIISIEVVLNKIIFTLSEALQANATISYYAPLTGVVSSNFITNTNNLEILCFNKYPVDNSGLNDTLLITQYYEGENQDKWIEVKNISGVPINANDYYLALYNESSIASMSISSADFIEPIPALAVDEVILFKNSGATLPGLANLGSATIITSQVADFDGDDVILLSTRNDASCFAHRQDIIGELNWAGQNISIIRGGDNEAPEENFNLSSWIVLSVEDDVNGAQPGTNAALGTQTMGNTIWNGISWSNLDPDISRNVEISASYSANFGNIEAYNLTINASQILDFDENTINTVVVNNNLDINGTFLLGDTESLITKGDANSISGSILKNEKSTSLNNSFDFTYWSSPIQNATIANVFSGVDQNRIFHWRAPFDGNYGGWEIANGTMINGKGYISEAPSGLFQHSINFGGTPNSGNIDIPVGFDSVLGPAGGGFNLIGNPYPSAVNIDDFIEFDNGVIDNSEVDGTIWLWTHNTAFQDNPGSNGDYSVNDYATYNRSGGVSSGDPGSGSIIPTNNIGSGQGFFIRTTSAGVVHFTNDMRIKNANNQFFRNTKSEPEKLEKDRFWLNVSSEQGGAFNQILIGFFDEATDGVDRGFDGLKFSGGNYISLYSILDNNRYAIQGLGSYNPDKKIKIGFDNYIKEDFEITLGKVEGVLKNENIYLIDSYTNTIHDLKTSPYKFSGSEIGSFSDRFSIQFNKFQIQEEELINDFIVVSTDNVLEFKSNVNITNITIHDMLGRLLISEKPNATYFKLNSSNITNGSVLIVNATLDSGIKVNKKTIKL